MKSLGFAAMVLAIVAIGTPLTITGTENGLTLQIAGCSPDSPLHVVVREGVQTGVNFRLAYPAPEPCRIAKKDGKTSFMKFNFVEQEGVVVVVPEFSLSQHGIGSSQDADRVAGKEFAVVPGEMRVFKQFSDRGVPPITFRIVPQYPSVPTATHVVSHVESIDALGIVDEGWHRVEFKLRNNRNVDVLGIQFGYREQRVHREYGTEGEPIAKAGETWVESLSVNRRYLQTEDEGYVIDPRWPLSIEIQYVEFVDGMTDGDIAAEGKVVSESRVVETPGI